MIYQPVMGLEIHAELLTETKVFCSCKNEFGGEKNSRICPVCIGLPGAMPTLNQNAVTLAVRAGLALGCKINNFSAFDRKNYFYPDLPKSYQITQFEYPICEDGSVKLTNKSIRINRIHIEEDAGKLIHNDGMTEIDFNRCGVPLIEIVTDPDFESIDEVIEFVDEVASRLKYSDVCDARPEQGSMRVDVNISLKPAESSELGIRAELKNLNSRKFIRRALEFEIKRQTAILQKGDKVIQETRRFNEENGETMSLRGKEGINDYRYFPEPDLPAISLNDTEIEKIKSHMPELAYSRFTRYTESFGLNTNDARLILENKAFADFFEKAAKINKSYKTVANLMIGELNRNLNESRKGIGEISFSAYELAELAALSDNRKISKGASKEILKIMFDTGRKPEEIAKTENLFLEDNSENIAKITIEVLENNKENVASYKNGTQKLYGFFIGEIMHRAGKGTNPVTVREILDKALSEFKKNS